MDILLPSTSSKQLVFVSRSGPAFSVSEIFAAHTELDRAGVARYAGERQLSLTERIAHLHGQIISLRGQVQS